MVSLSREVGYSITARWRLKMNSIHLHGIIPIEGLALWFDRDTSPTTRNQLPSDLLSDRPVTVSEQQVQESLSNLISIQTTESHCT